MEQVKILVADDERIERSILCRKISRVLGECCQIIQAENGREAVSLFEEKRPQIAVLDIAMPGINGIEAAARIRQMDSDCILIFLTAYSDFHYSVQAIRLRALDYLTKPCDNDELFAVLETAVYQAQSRLEKEEQGQPEVQGQPEPQEQPEVQEQPEPQELTNEPEVSFSNTIAAQIREFISQNYMHDISMQDAARFLGYADTYFCRLFKQGFGSNFTAYLTKYRMQEAGRLLRTTELSVKEVAERTGYQDANYFAKVFKRQMGVIPSEYRNEKADFYG